MFLTIPYTNKTGTWGVLYSFGIDKTKHIVILLHRCFHLFSFFHLYCTILRSVWQCSDWAYHLTAVTIVYLLWQDKLHLFHVY